MHSTLALSSLLLAASSVHAYPQVVSVASAAVASSSVAPSATPSASSVSSLGGSRDQSVTVILQNQASELGSQTTFKNVNGPKEKAPVGSSGPFETIEISLGADVANVGLRCSALDMNGDPIIAIRNANTDTTFSDQDKGPWTFIAPTEVSAVVCDPTFTAVAAGSYDVIVTLQDQATELGTQTTLKGVVRDVQMPVGSTGPFSTVEISAGPLVDPLLRCKLKNVHNRAIVATRGENIDTTFSDQDKGPWTFNKPQNVAHIICDPAFVAAPQQ